MKAKPAVPTVLFPAPGNSARQGAFCHVRAGEGRVWARNIALPGAAAHPRRLLRTGPEGVRCEIVASFMSPVPKRQPLAPRAATTRSTCRRGGRMCAGGKLRAGLQFYGKGMKMRPVSSMGLLQNRKERENRGGQREVQQGFSHARNNASFVRVNQRTGGPARPRFALSSGQGDDFWREKRQRLFQFAIIPFIDLPQAIGDQDGR